MKLTAVSKPRAGKASKTGLYNFKRSADLLRMKKRLLKAQLDRAGQAPPLRPIPGQYPYSRTFITISGFLLIPVVAFAEIFTGYKFGFDLFFIFPVLLVTQAAGARWGVLAAAACSGAWLATDLSQERAVNDPLWNLLLGTAVRFYIFGTVIGILRTLAREKKFARRDYLTGLPNRQAFFEMAQNEFSRARRYMRPMSFAYLDCDNFKQVNDTYGHQAGNKLLKVLAETLQRNIRSTDIPVRLGGDEFGVLMPETDDEASRVAMGRIRKVLLENMIKNGWPVTFSAGVITCANVPSSADEMIRMADNLMYEVKNGGKNNIRHEVYRDLAQKEMSRKLF